MGAIEKQQTAQLAKEEAKLAKLNDELALDLTQAALDVAGIADPTPISDVLGAGLSAFRGDFIGAGLSLISAVPYAGDALAKTAKGARLAKKMAALKETIQTSINAVAKTKALQLGSRKFFSAKVRAQRAVEQAKKISAAKKCVPCKMPSGNRFSTKSPKEGSSGSWEGGERGNSDWYPDPTTDKGKAVLKATKGKPVTFKEGYPNFTPHATHRVEIKMKGDFNDRKTATDAVRKQLNDDNWYPPKGMIWHHHQDGVTMELVSKHLNGKISHTGGASITKSLKQDPGY